MVTVKTNDHARHIHQSHTPQINGDKRNLTNAVPLYRIFTPINLLDPNGDKLRNFMRDAFELAQIVDDQLA